MRLLVIHEKDHDDEEEIVIGVADSVEKANIMIKEYYHDYEQVSFNDIRDSSLESSRVLLLRHKNGNDYYVTVTLEWFTLNEL